MKQKGRENESFNKGWCPGMFFTNMLLFKVESGILYDRRSLA
jgi:hypothetical protein